MSRILAVDDDPAALGAIQGILLQGGFEVKATTSGEEALTWLESNTADIVLLDVVMPGLSGYAVCERIRADPKTKSVPVVFLTGLGHEEDRTEGKRAGSDLYLQKPLLGSNLIKMIGVFLGDEARKV
jgi:two-component system cell cycle response regulator